MKHTAGWNIFPPLIKDLYYDDTGRRGITNIPVSMKTPFACIETRSNKTQMYLPMNLTIVEITSSNSGTDLTNP